MVDPMAQAARVGMTFKKSDAPTVAVMVGDARAPGEAAEAEGGVGGVVAVQTEQLAHADDYRSVEAPCAQVRQMQALPWACTGMRCINSGVKVAVTHQQGEPLSA